MEYEVIPCQMTFLHGHNSMVKFLKNAIFKAFGPLTKCKIHVNFKLHDSQSYIYYYDVNRSGLGMNCHLTSVFGQTTCPKNNKGCALVGTRSAKRKQQRQQHNNHNFECLHSMFANQHIHVVLLSSTPLVSN